MRNNTKVSVSRFEQSALILQTEDTQIAIDFGCLTEELPIAVRSATAVVISHVHGDHFHRPHIDSLGAPVWASAEVVEILADSDSPATLLKAGETVAIGEFRVTPINVDHGAISAPISNLGLIFEIGDIKVFFAGDMAVPSDTSLSGVDILILPVGGGKVFSPEEAADYVITNKYSGQIIPVHYHGQSDPSCGVVFKALVEATASAVVLEVGESLTVGL